MSELLDGLIADWELARGGALAKAPLYHQLYSVLRQSILDGSIPCRTQLPTEQQLAAAFDVSRITAKRAMDELAGEGLVERSRGRGSHVTYQYTPQSADPPQVGMLDDPAEIGQNSVVRVILCEKVFPPADIGKRLAVGDGETVHKLVRVCSDADGVPFAYCESWTKGVSHGFTPEVLEQTPRLEVIGDNGVRIAKIEQELSAESASGQVAAELGVEPGTALLSMRRQSHDEGGDVVDIVDCVFNPRRFRCALVLSPG